MILGPNLGVAVVGVVLWGLGASLGFPVGMSAAADDPRTATASVAAVATIGYFAFLIGPPLIGLLGEQVGLLNAFWVVVRADRGRRPVRHRRPRTGAPLADLRLQARYCSSDLVGDDPADLQGRGRGRRRSVQHVDLARGPHVREVVDHGAVPPQRLRPNARRCRLQAVVGQGGHELAQAGQEPLVGQRSPDLADAGRQNRRPSRHRPGQRR